LSLPGQDILADCQGQQGWRPNPASCCELGFGAGSDNGRGRQAGLLPGTDHPLPKALDDAAVTKLLRAGQADRRMLVRVTAGMLLRTGLRVSEYTGLRADAVVYIGAGPWLYVPVGKLREGRYLPLHPQLVTLIDGYRARHVPDDHSLLLPRENGRALDRHTVTRFINKVGAAAGLPHIHPHQFRHTLATQAINRA
jgi:integrase